MKNTTSSIQRIGRIEALRERPGTEGERAAAEAAIARIAKVPAKGEPAPRQRLTDALCRKLPAPAKGKKIYYDSEIPGFGLRITEADARSFVLRYRRKADGVERTHTIGGFSSWSSAAAREEAARLKRLVDGGGDPLGEAREARAAPTVADLADRFEAEYLPRKRASTAADYKSMLRVYVKPMLGRKKVASVEFSDIDDLHRRVTARGNPYRANRVLAVTSKMFSLAVQWKMRTDNPCRGVARNDEAARVRYLSAAELERLLKALDEHDDRDAADIFRLLLLTGCRRGEALAARWSDFDLKKGIWTKPAATTKIRRNHTVPLNDSALELLRARPHESTEFVFAARHGAGHRIGVKGNWRRVLKAAKITDLRIHDLRHSYASILANAGVGLFTIGGLLGHVKPATTARYAHLFDENLREATQHVGALIKKAAP